jgi:hypothetical protein
MLWGPLDRLAGGHKLPVLVGARATAAALFYLAFAGPLTPFMLVVWFAAFGFFTGFGPLLIAHGKALFPIHQVGRRLTVFNMRSMGGTFLVQTVSGFVIGLFPTASNGAYALDAHRWVFGLQATLILLGCLTYSGSYDPARGRRSPAPNA